MKKAFTLIEILIVVILLGILAAVVVPQFVDQTQVAEDAAAAQTASTLNSAWQQYCAAYYASNGAQPAVPADKAAAIALLTGGNYIDATPDETNITITFTAGADAMQSRFAATGN